MASEKALRFAREYMIDLNARQAAIRAGYKAKTAAQQGSRLLNDVNVQAEIARAREEFDEHYKYRVAQKYEVLAKLTDIMRGDLGNLLPEGDDLENLSLKRAKELGMSALIKKIETFTIVRQVPHEDDKGNVTLIDEQTTTAKVELYSAHEAARDLGKHHQLFTENVDITSGGKPIAIAVIKEDIDKL